MRDEESAGAEHYDVVDGERDFLGVVDLLQFDVAYEVGEVCGAQAPDG